MKFLKYILPTLLITLISFTSNSANYFVSGSVKFEDRLNADFDANDIDVRVKAIFQQNPGNANVGNVLLLVEVVAMGAADNLELRLNPAAFGQGGVVLLHKEGGTCDNGTDNKHADCLNNGAVWTPNVTKYNAAGEVYPNPAAWNTFTYPWGGIQDPYDILVMNASDMFDSACTKSTLVNTENGFDCNSKTIAITLEEMGLTWGDSHTNDLDTDCAGAGCEVNNQLDLAKLFKVRNLTQGRDVIAGAPGNFVFHTPINIGYPTEGVHWFEAFVGLDQAGWPSPSGDEGYSSSLGGTVKVKFCDPRDGYTAGPTQLQCEEGLADWFGGGLHSSTLGGGISTAKLNTNNTQDYASRRVVETNSITTAGFDIHQICNSAGGEPIFGGCIANWDPQKGGGNLHLITQYYFENAHGHSGLGSRERRDLCLISDACEEGAGATSPSNGGNASTRVAPIVSGHVDYGGITLSNAALLHDNIGGNIYNLIPKTAGSTYYNYFWYWDTKSANGTCPDPKTLTTQDLTDSCSDPSHNNEYDCINAGACTNPDPAANAAQHTSQSMCTSAGTCSDVSHVDESSCLMAGTCSDNTSTSQYTCEGFGDCSDSNYDNDKSTCEYFGNVFTQTYTWTPTNTWTSDGNTWISANNTWTAIAKLFGKTELKLSSNNENYYTFAYEYTSPGGSPKVHNDLGSTESVTSINTTGGPTRGVPGANFLLKQYWNMDADVVNQTYSISNDFLATAPCSTYQYQTTCDGYDQCSWNSSANTCDFVYLSGYSNYEALTNGTSSTNNVCIFSFITEQNVDPYSGPSSSIAVFSDASTDMTVTKFKVDVTVSAIPAAEQSNYGYCSNNNLGTVLNDYGSVFKQCIKATLDGANSYNGLTSETSIPVTLENSPAYP